jgi:hypothetical protein
MAISHDPTTHEPTRSDVAAPRTVPAERTTERRSWRPATIGPAMILGGLGAAGVIVSFFFAWRTGSIQANDVPVAFLWDRDTTADSPSLLLLLIPLTVVLLVGTFLPMGRGLRLVGGIGLLIVVGLFAYQLYRVADAFGTDLGDALDTGFYFAAVGAVLAFASAFLRSGWAARRTVDREVRDDAYQGAR